MKKIVIILILCLSLTIIIIPKTNAYESIYKQEVYYIDNAFDYVVLNGNVYIEDDTFVAIDSNGLPFPSSNTNLENYRVFKYYDGNLVHNIFRLRTKYTYIRNPNGTQTRVNDLRLISSEMVYYDGTSMINSNSAFNYEINFSYYTSNGWETYHTSGDSNSLNIVSLDFNIPDKSLLKDVSMEFYNITDDVFITRSAYVNKTSIYDSLEYYNGIDITIEQINPNFSDFIINSVGGFLNFEIIPGWSISTILAICIMIPVLLYVLKYFFGG